MSRTPRPFKLEVQTDSNYTDRMKIKPRQFKSTEEIELFLAEKEDSLLDNIMENINEDHNSEEDIVKAFNKSINSLAELIS